MEPQQINPINPIESAPPAPSGASRFRALLITGIAIVITALVVGGGVYGVMSKRLAAERTKLEHRITDLQNQIAQLQVIDTAENEVDTFNWKTYKDEDYAFSISIPESFEVSKGIVNLVGSGPAASIRSTESIGGLARGEFYITIDVLANSKKLPVGQWYQEYYTQELKEWKKEGGPFGLDEPSELKEVKLGDFVVLQSGSNRYPLDIKVITIFANGERIYFVYRNPHGEYLAENEDKLRIFKEVNERIISTFKFLDTAPVSTVDWKTFKSTDFNIVFKYPSSWTLSTTYRDHTVVVSKKPLLASDILEHRAILMIINNYWEHGTMGLYLDKSKKVVVGDINAEVIQYRNEDDNKIGLLLINMADQKKRQYGIEFRPSTNEQESDVAVFYNIVSSMEFID